MWKGKNSFRAERNPAPVRPARSPMGCWGWYAVVVVIVVALTWDAVWAASVRVEDFRGKTIVLPQPARRIVCLIESALSGLYMLGVKDRVVGVPRSVYQGAVRPYYEALDDRIRNGTLAAPGNWDFINMESVVALKPDLVVLWAHQSEAVQALERRGLAVFGVFIERFEDVHREMRALGILTGTAERAEALIGLAEEEKRWVRDYVHSLGKSNRPSVYFMWAQGDLETSGGTSTVNELLEAAGGRNVFGHLPREHLVVHRESLLQADPEVIVMWVNEARDPAHILTDPRWRFVRAVREGRVHELPDIFTSDLWTLKYPLAILTVASWLHPDAFPDTDLKGRRMAFLEKLYGSSTVARVAIHGFSD
ncbi:MAG: ABC transporter substrate-binding protein [Desulfacinum sp.]|jgi:iron complex transport system substrate-binding protein|nr:ABC transporter substrate-binding protein [Desulfacinum sp.]MBZ4658120.1 btuF 1 [Desulfacinum sp.]